MAFPNYYSVVPNSCVESLAPVDANPWDGYKWYQSHPSSEGMTASPLHYPVEYRPPEPPPLSSHGNSPNFTFNPYYSPSHMPPYATPPPSPNLHTNCAPYMYTPPFTIPCQTIISTGQNYYTHESTAPVTTTTTIVTSPKLIDTPLTSATSVKGNQWEETLTKVMAILDRMQERCEVRSIVDDKTIQDEVVIGDGSRLGETVVEDEDNLQVDVLKSGRAVVGTVGGNDQADTSKLVKEVVEVQGELIVDAIEVEPQVFDKSPSRESTAKSQAPIPITGNVFFKGSGDAYDEDEGFSLFTEAEESVKEVESDGGEKNTVGYEPWNKEWDWDDESDIETETEDDDHVYCIEDASAKNDSGKLIKKNVLIFAEVVGDDASEGLKGSVPEEDGVMEKKSEKNSVEVVNVGNNSGLQIRGIDSSFVGVNYKEGKTESLVAKEMSPMYVPKMRNMVKGFPGNAIKNNVLIYDPGGGITRKESVANNTSQQKSNLNGETLPQLFITIVRYVLPSEDHTVQKLLLLYLEIIEKRDTK